MSMAVVITGDVNGCCDHVITGDVNGCGDHVITVVMSTAVVITLLS